MASASDSASDSTPNRRYYFVTMLLVGLAIAVSGYTAWSEQQTRTIILDVDGWGYATKLIDQDRAAVWELFLRPSLWKGPIVPTIYGLAYFVVPHAFTILVFNIVCFAISVGWLHRLLLLEGGDIRPATLAILGWILYPPHHLIFGYYFAEPLLTLFSTALLWLAVRRSRRPFLVGLFAGITLLARPPMLLVIAGVPLLVAAVSWRARARWLLLYALGGAITFLPWGLRNLAVTGTFIPFTTEGGQALFLGTELEHETIHWGKLLQEPEVVPLAEAAPPRDESPVEQMHYWSGLAQENVRRAPLEQMLHVLRKGMRFWCYVPDGSWWPTWKSALPPLIFLPLAFYGAWRERRRRFTRLAVWWVVGLWFMHAVIIAVTRYSFPILPLVLFYAAIGLFRFKWTVQESVGNEL